MITLLTLLNLMIPSDSINNDLVKINKLIESSF